MAATTKPRLRPHRDDVLIAVCGAVGGVLLWSMDLYNNPAQGERYGALALIPLAAVSLAALGRRVAQPWVLAVAFLALVADAFTGSLLMTILLFSDVVYAAALYGSARVARVVLPTALALTVAATMIALAALRNPESVLLGVLFALITIMPASTGLLVRHHRERAATERLRAEQTALLAEMDRTQAVHAERARMARELHDVVAGHLSAIAVHSTAAQTLRDGTATADALEVIRSNSVQGLAEMRRLIGLLRSSDPDEEYDQPSAAPKLTGLTALVEQAENSAEGLRFALSDGHKEGGALPAPVELAAYRLVQESVTNAVKHSAPGTVTVRLGREHTGSGADRLRAQGPAHRSREVLVVSVSNPLDTERQPRVPGAGAGLTGMRERVALLGGEFSAGPNDGQWLTRAVLPLHEGAGAR